MKKQLLTLFALLAFGTAFSQTVLLSEDFSTKALPIGWSNDSLGLPGTMLWEFNNPKPRVITGAGFDTAFAIIDSDLYGNGHKQNASLTTPAFSTVGFLQANLIFSEQFQYFLPSHHDISYSTDGGTSWISIRNDSANIGFPNPAVQTTLVLPAGAINQATVQIKFTYVASWGWWWAIDKLSVIGLNNCTGTPTTGTITGCPASVCSNISYNLNLTGSSQNFGITYQWMSSTNGTIYTPIVGATGTSLHDSTNTTPLYYQVVVTCTASATSATTTPVSIATGTITPGTIVGCPASVCPNVPYNMNLTGSSPSLGVTYQWMSSTNGTTYTPVIGATGMNHSDNINAAPIYYHVVLSCPLSNSVDSTPVVSVTTINSTTLCYCVPTHPPCSNGFMYYLDVTGTTLNHTDSVCTNAVNGAYTSYPATGNTTASFEQGMSYTFNITTNSTNIISVWIDYDQSGVFDPTEWTQICTNSVSGIVNTATVTIPPTATLGLTGMRIRSRLNANPNGAPDACTTFGSGEGEDYLVTIVIPNDIKTNNQSNFNLYPNPAQNTVRIELKNAGVTSGISITDVVGNEVINTVISNKSNAVLNVSDLPNGVYQVSINNEYGNTVKKLIISK